MKEIDLNEYLKKYKNTSIDFYRFPGNYGDSLIWHGTKNLMSDLNINVEYVDVSFPVYNDVLFIDGGGNFNDYYSDVRSFLIKKGGIYKEIIILPHTIFGNRQVEILNSLDSDVTVFCREKHSFDFLKENFQNGEVYLWHDCAFYNHISSKKKGSGILKVFRSDGESIFKKIDSSKDLSSNGYARSPLDQLLNTLDEYEEIHTDRLHIAITSVLLDKKVKLFSNSYYKNKAVYEYSLVKYSNIQFVESEQKNTLNLNPILISDIFTKFINNVSEDKNKELTDDASLEDLVFLLIYTNRKLWNLEDDARMHEKGSDYIAKAKKLIDENNQIRNNIIKKIDETLAESLDVNPDPKATFYSESPGMIMDRLSIIFIKLLEIQKISQIIKENDLKEEYLNKEKLIMRQVETLTNFLKIYFVQLKNKEVYFSVQDAVKIYNDNRVKKYIKQLKQDRFFVTKSG